MASKLLNIPDDRFFFFYKEKCFSERANYDTKLVDLNIRTNEKIHLSKRWCGGEQ